MYAGDLFNIWNIGGCSGVSEGPGDGSKARPRNKLEPKTVESTYLGAWGQEQSCEDAGEQGRESGFSGLEFGMGSVLDALGSQKRSRTRKILEDEGN